MTTETDRQEFEAEFPPRLGVYWSPERGQYDGRYIPEVALQNARWETWQAARAKPCPQCEQYLSLLDRAVEDTDGVWDIAAQKAIDNARNPMRVSKTWTDSLARELKKDRENSHD